MDAQQVVEKLRANFFTKVTFSADWRARQLSQLKKMIEENKTLLADAMRQDLGQSPFQVDLVELGTILEDLECISKNFRSWMKPKSVSLPFVQVPGTGSQRYDPLGVVLIIAPWNYPIQLCLEPLAGALAAGNCVVVKPSEISPNVSSTLATLIPKYLDPRAVTVVEGGVFETTELLKQRFDHILYTGNGTVAKVVMEAAAKHLTPVTLELGGKSPCIVDENVDLVIACKRIVWGTFLNCGQTCIHPDYALVHERVYERFLQQIKKTIAEFYGEDPKKSADYSRIINTRHTARLANILKNSRGKIVVGGEIDQEERYISPTVLRDVPHDDSTMQDENFGPIFPCIRIGSIDEAIRFVETRPKPLALYIFSANKDVQERVLSETTSGSACVNEVLMQASCPELPFGGVGPSGMGAYHGEKSFRTFSHEKSVISKPLWGDVPVRYPPYTQGRQKALLALRKVDMGLIRKAIGAVIIALIACAFYQALNKME